MLSHHERIILTIKFDLFSIHSSISYTRLSFQVVRDGQGGIIYFI